MFRPHTTRGIPASSCRRTQDKISLSGLSLAEIVLTAVNSVPSREEQGWLGGLGVSEDMSVRCDPLLHPETLQADASISFVHVCLTGIGISRFVNAHPGVPKTANVKPGGEFSCSLGSDQSGF